MPNPAMPEDAGAQSPDNGTQIPDKLYFRIGDVSRLIGVKPYVLRFWEQEFSSIAPKKSGTNHRLYRRKDVELLLEIKHLLYEKRYTIEGARKHLEERSRPAPAPKVKKRTAKQGDLFGAPEPVLTRIRKELAEILSLLG
jgi:DNA-binding transcriptional MerR regulator